MHKAAFALHERSITQRPEMHATSLLPMPCAAHADWSQTVAQAVIVFLVCTAAHVQQSEKSTQSDAVTQSAPKGLPPVLTEPPVVPDLPPKAVPPVPTPPVACTVLPPVPTPPVACTVLPPVPTPPVACMVLPPVPTPPVACTVLPPVPTPPVTEV